MAAAEPGRIVEHRGRVMGSEFHLQARGVDPIALHMAEADLQRLESLWTRFSTDSDIGRLNAAHGIPVEVAPETIMLVTAMIDAWHRTDGRYDPSVLRALVGWGYGASRVDPSRSTVLPPPGSRPASFGEVRVDEARGTITLPLGMAIDAGGIGKGLAADMAVDGLLAAGAEGALAAVGGDLAMAGAGPLADGWLVEVERPNPEEGILCALTVSHGGVATSSTRSRRWEVAGSAQHHCIDPSTGAPSDTDLAAVTVFAPTGWEAEVHATAALIAGSAESIEHLRRHGLTGIATTVDGRILRTDDLRDLEMNASPEPARSSR